MTPTNIDRATILVVDDNPTNLKVLSEALTDTGWTILVATDGEDAIDQAEYAQPDLILLDVMMPGIDGFETCQRLKASSSTHDIPVIFTTALSYTFDKVEGLSRGAVDYITKPFEIKEVLARVKVHLKLRFLTKQLEDQNVQLEKRSAELSNAMHELQQFQLQLVQSEKMSTLGLLVASVASEIKSPLSFIAGNLSHASEYVSALINHLQLYRAQYPNPVKEILEDAQAIDLEELLQNLPQLISSLKIGTDCISDISTSLRTFERSDTKVKVAYDIHQGIDSTLMLLKHQLKANNKRPEIKIIKNYGDLPLVSCYPGQLNQVFMNLISNAIDALDESSRGYSYIRLLSKANTITIHTKMNSDNSCVTISVKDNGQGMSSEIKQRLFDQYFTTKFGGKGTGLGLSISRQIVEDKHQGRLSCISELGKGTEFVVEIPSDRSRESGGSSPQLAIR